MSAKGGKVEADTFSHIEVLNSLSSASNLHRILFFAFSQGIFQYNFHLAYFVFGGEQFSYDTNLFMKHLSMVQMLATALPVVMVSCISSSPFFEKLLTGVVLQEIGILSSLGTLAYVSLHMLSFERTYLRFCLMQLGLLISCSGQLYLVLQRVINNREPNRDGIIYYQNRVITGFFIQLAFALTLEFQPSDIFSSIPHLIRGAMVLGFLVSLALFFLLTLNEMLTYFSLPLESDSSVFRLRALFWGIFVSLCTVLLIYLLTGGRYRTMNVIGILLTFGLLLNFFYINSDCFTLRACYLNVFYALMSFFFVLLCQLGAPALFWGVSKDIPVYVYQSLECFFSPFFLLAQVLIPYSVEYSFLSNLMMASSLFLISTPIFMGIFWNYGEIGLVQYIFVRLTADFFNFYILPLLIICFVGYVGSCSRPRSLFLRLSLIDYSLVTCNICLFASFEFLNFIPRDFSQDPLGTLQRIHFKLGFAGILFFLFCAFLAYRDRRLAVSG